MQSKNNDVDYLLSPLAIRDQARAIFEATLENRTHFRFHSDRMDSTVDYVLSIIRKNYPDLKIPFHSRWGHFRVGGVDRIQSLNQRLSGVNPIERARVKLDLAVTSVLLDAGAGAEWRFKEGETGQSFSRSEGLGVASFYLFLDGALSSDSHSLRADSAGLKNLDEETLVRAFQVSSRNHLIGVEGRVSLLRNLGKAVENSALFKDNRPGNLIDLLQSRFGKIVPAPGILRAILDGFGTIWPGRVTLQGVNLGDVWSHSLFDLVPFHKLSQWMTYSLIEPILEAGLNVVEVENLTGLAEYRNGGLMIDSGLISLKDPSLLEKAWTPDSDLVIEWRALTLFLLDEIGTRVQKALGMTPQEFPLAKVLEGGTWWAGRFLAQEKRAGGNPPLSILSDGTVF